MSVNYNIGINDWKKGLPHQDFPVCLVYRQTNKEHLLHSHEPVEIALILTGKLNHESGGQTVRLTAGDIIIIPPGVVHGYSETAEAAVMNVLFDPYRLPLPLLSSNLPGLVNLFAPGKRICANPVSRIPENEMPQTVELLEKINNELQYERQDTRFYVLALLMEFLVIISRHQLKCNVVRQSKSTLQNILHFIAEHYRQRITVAELAHLARMSERTFYRIFKESTGESPLDYVNSIRLQHASELLLNTEKSITQIADECGFQDAGYFSVLFKKQYSSTPRKYRQQ